MSKKKIIAIITIIVLLFAAGISVGVFLYGRGETEAADGSQTSDQNQVPNGNQDIQGTLAEDNDQNKENNENAVTNPDDGEGETTTPAEGNTDEVEDNEIVENDNQNANNNNVEDNTDNEDTTTDNNVGNIGETTITRVEEQERLISEDFLDWWQPMTVAVRPTEVGLKLPQITVKKAAITEVGDAKLVYRGQDITYVIAVTNNGKTPVENIEITDRIPEKTTYVDDSIENPVILKYVDGELTSEVVGTKTTVEAENKVVGVKWVVSIPAGETVIARFTVNVNKTMLNENEEEIETTGTILNMAIANGEESNEVQTSIIRTHKSSIVVRDGNVVDSKTVKVGDKITYTISIENTGDVEGTTYVIDKVPVGTQFISAQEGAKVTKSIDTSIIWTVTIPAHTTITREFTVEVTSVDGLIKNIADVGGTPTNEDIIDTANIDVIKTATAVKNSGEDEFTTPVGKVKENDIIQYTIVVKNTGSRDLTNVLLEEQLEGVEVKKLVVDDVEKAIEKDAETGKLIIGDLRAAKEATEESNVVEAGVAIITAEYKVTYENDIKGKGNEDGTIIPIYNKVIATGETIPDPKNPNEVPEQVEDNDDETVSVAQDPRFEVVKTAIEVKRVGEDAFSTISGKVRPGDIVKYQIVVTNTGNTKLTNIVVTDTLSVRVESENGELKEVNPETGVSTLKIIPSLVSGAKETIFTYYVVDEKDMIKDANELEIINNIVKAKPDELEEKEDDETIPVNPNTIVAGTKTWDDNDNQDGKRPQSITIRLLADGNEVDNKIVKASDNWSWSFEKLPLYDGETKITYTITEDTVLEYTTDVNGYNVTNIHIPETTVVEGTKTWIDNNNQDGKRPESITIRLLADGNEVDNKVVKASDNWLWSFGDLPVYKKGSKITYTITEDAVNDYTTNVNGYNVTNTHTPETIVIEGTKTWNDNNNQDGKRPESITIRLLADGNEVDNKVVKASDNWSWSFGNLPVYKSGTKITYTITEDVVSDYTTIIDGYNVTNTHIPETTTIQGTKTWVDNNNQDRKRPQTITIRLLANGNEVDYRVVKESDNWSWEFENIPVYANGSRITYTISENQVSGYAKPEVNGYNVTNTILQQYDVDISGTKKWYVPDRYNVPNIIIRLYQNGNAFKKANGEDLTFEIKNGAETYEFTGLPKYKIENGKYVIDANGNFAENVYTVSEDEISGFKSEQNGFDFINTIQEKISISGTKIWDDNNNQDGKRPSTITINLWADGEKLNNKPDISKEQDSEGKWTYTFKDLERYSNLGKEITYVVTEETVQGYETPKINRYDITNKHTPEITTIKGTKTWVDGDNKYGKRPTSITVNLLANGTEVDSRTIEPDSNGNWPSYEFKDKPVYSNGSKIRYTITEDAVEGYTSSTNGYNLTNTYNEPTGTITRNWDITSTTETPIPVDVVFILDTSLSMIQNTTRGADMINAVNSAIDEILEFNDYNRVSVVGFSEDGMYGDLHKNKTDASVLLKLGRYQIKDTSNKKSYLVKEDDKVYTNVNKENGDNYSTKKRYFEQGTYTQAGIKLGAEQLMNASTTVKINNKTVQRVPVIILLSDGEPTAFTTTYNSPEINIENSISGTVTYNSNKRGTGQLKNNSALYGYYTILTANYYKQQVTSHYNNTSAKMFTIAMELTTYYGETVLNPTSKNITTCSKTTENNEENTITNKNIAKDLAEYLKYTVNTKVEYTDFDRDSDGKLQKDSNGNLKYKTKTITIKPSNEEQYKGSYADKAFKEKMTAKQLQEAMIGSITETTSQSEKWTLSGTTQQEKDSCKANLPNIDKQGTFSLVIKKVDGTEIKYTSFDQAFNGASGNPKVLNGNDTSGYYLDLKLVPAGATVTLSYRQK